MIAGAVHYTVRRNSPRFHAVSKWVAVATAITAIGTVYGAWQAVQDPVRLDAWTGRPVILQASLVSAKNVSDGRLYELAVREIELNGVTRRCQVKAEWAVWNPSGAIATLTVGSAVDISGILVFPPVHTRKGAPLRSDLAQAGIYYEFEGRLLGVMPPENSLATSVRDRLAKSVTRLPYGTADEQTLLSSVVFGGEDVSANEKQVFLQAGLLHILAASGANLMLVEQAVVRVLRPLWNRLRLPSAAWSLLLLSFNWAFALLCGMGASMTRAAVLASYRQVGQMLSRRVRTLDGLAVGAIIQAVVSPSQVGSASFLLSFVATGALALVLEKASMRPAHIHGGRFRKVARVLLMHFWSVFVTSIAIELALLPLTFTLFQQITPYAVVTNVLAEPLLAVLLPVAALYIAFAAVVWLVPLVFYFATPLAAVTYGMLSAVTWLANTVAKWPFALILTPTMPNAKLIAAGLYAVVIGVIVASSRRQYNQSRRLVVKRKRRGLLRRKHVREL